jgi:hypothetical protein
VGGSIWALSWESTVSGVGNRKSGDGPGPLDWLKAIGASKLKRREKLILYALTEFVEYGKIEAACHPAVNTIGNRCSCDARTVQRSLKALEDIGILSYHRRSHGRMAHEMLFDYRKLIGLNPANATGLQSKGAHSQPRQRDPQPRQPVTPTPSHRRSTPSESHPNYHEPTIGTTKELEADSQATNGMDGAASEATRKRRAHILLKAKGVQGKNLNELASCERVTPEMIEGEWYRISQDPNVRNATAVLVRKLAEIAGISLGSKKALADMPPKERNKIFGMQARIEEKQRDIQRSAS